jgi:hypothetical protein
MNQGVLLLAADGRLHPLLSPASLTIHFLLHFFSLRNKTLFVGETRAKTARKMRNHSMKRNGQQVLLEWEGDTHMAREKGK